LGKCKARYLTHLKDVYNFFIISYPSLSLNSPRCHTCQLIKKFDSSDHPFDAIRLIVQQHRYFKVRNYDYYLCDACYLRPYHCRTCREEFIMDGTMFKKLVFGQGDRGLYYVGDEACDLPRSGKFPQNVEMCHSPSYAPIVPFVKPVIPQNPFQGIIAGLD
jgi:hypothetical protein